MGGRHLLFIFQSRDLHIKHGLTLFEANTMLHILLKHDVNEKRTITRQSNVLITKLQWHIIQLICSIFLLVSLQQDHRIDSWPERLRREFVGHVVEAIEERLRQ